jgi:hypothetical protein
VSHVSGRGEQSSADLDSVLGATPRRFGSPILRPSGQHKHRIDPSGPTRRLHIPSQFAR